MEKISYLVKPIKCKRAKVCARLMLGVNKYKGTILMTWMTFTEHHHSYYAEHDV